MNKLFLTFICLIGLCVACSETETNDLENVLPELEEQPEEEVKPEEEVSDYKNDRVYFLTLNTESQIPINSKEDYRDAQIVLSDTNGVQIFASHDVRVKGRGNSTWTKFPKKPYQIKFDTKESLLGMPEDKKWVLLANYSDKTLQRNEMAFELSRLSTLEWTPESRYVEVQVNGEYLGLYQLTQKVEVTDHRVNLGDEGFLLEVDNFSKLDPDDVYFETSNYLFNIKEPELSVGDAQYNQIKAHIQLIESVLLGENFKDPKEGYAKYMDVASFVDWYLINEIAKNNDAIFYSSTYLNYIPGEKLKMGPVWDFDIGFGNINYNGNETTDGFWIKKSVWYTRLFEDPNFVAKVKARFDFFYENKALFLEKIKRNHQFLDKAQESNFEKWPILGTYVWPNYVYFETYEQELQYLEEWIEARFEWLHLSIHQL